MAVQLPMTDRLDDGISRLRRSMGTKIPIGSVSLPLSAIIGIAVGGALVLFVALSTIGIVLARKKHWRETNRASQSKEEGHLDVDVRAAMRSTRPPEISFSNRLSFNPFLSLEDGISCHDWAPQDSSQNPPMAKAKRIPTQRGFFRMSTMRDSWPLGSNVPMALLTSPVAPPGYVVQEPKWPKRSSSILPRRKGSISDSGQNPPPRPQRSPTQDPFPPAPTEMPYGNLQRRSTSENQLSTILRSTSQRLKSAHRRSLTRTFTLGRFPGLPPTERLPTPPGKRPTESREALVNYAESFGSSLYDSYRGRTPSPGKDSRNKSPQAKRTRSPTPSAESADSLCGTTTPDLVMPEPLTSPSKNSLRGERRHRMRLSGGSKDISSMIQRDSRASLVATGGQDEKSIELYGPQRISLASDPFFSSVKSSKSVMPENQIHGPRPQPPLYIRKATFGQEATSERPSSFYSPLQDVSGNVQSSPKKAEPESESPTHSPGQNPFQWSPQEAMQTRATQTSPKRNGSKRKGHKRSNVVRISNLSSRPASSVEVVLEEPEEDSPLRFNMPSNPPIRIREPIKSPSRSTSTSSRRLSTRPPSSATFNPTLTVPELVPRSSDSSPTLGLEDIRGPVYSPTLSVCNYYTENGGGSEDEFFRGRVKAVQGKPDVDKAMLKARRHGRNYSADISLVPDVAKFVSFPPPSLADVPGPILTPPSSRPLPNITSTMASGFLQSFSATPAPPLLTMTVPAHLTGPRSEPSKINRSNRSPPRESLHSSINYLRRMNSEVSHYSTASSVQSNNSSPSLPSHSDSLAQSIETSPTSDFAERGRSRGSKHYLSVGMTPPKRDRETSDPSRVQVRQKIDKRDSHRVYQERRKKRNEEMLHDDRGDELTPVKEVSSPATGSDALGIVSLRFPTLSREGTNGPTPPRGNDRTREPGSGTGTPIKETLATPTNPMLNRLEREESPRWSDAMTKSKVSVVRRESKMEHPSPQTPPKFLGTLSGLGLAGQRLLGSGGSKKGNDELGNRIERPDSLGLYDQDGFLRSSPDREAARLEREKLREAKKVDDGSLAKRLSGFVM